MLMVLCLLATVAQTEVFVAPNGKDQNPGTQSRPVATIAHAIEVARTLQAHTITVRGGEYSLTNSIELDRRDAGLTIRAAKGSRPLITGSLSIPLSDIKPCVNPEILNRIIDPNARTQVQKINLKAILASPLFPTAPYGFTTPVSVASNELFADAEPMTVARWPNTGFTKVGTVTEPGNGEKDQDKPLRKPVFTGITDRAKLWSHAQDVWLFGYWKFDWADESIKVESIDEGTVKITLSKPHSYGVDKGADFFAENLIEELDQPGEYYLDRQNSVAYLIPPKSLKKVRLSVLGTPLLNIKSTERVTIQGLDFGYSRGNGIQVENSESVRVEGCQMYNLGERGASIDGGHLSGLVGCNIWNTGEGGVSLSGGDRKTLEPAKNFVENCDIHHFQRRTQTYRPAVGIAGVGNRVSHCSMHDAPHSAIIFWGNDHVIEYNEFYRNLGRTGDGGVVYTGRDWTARGTEIRYNHFFDNIGMSKWEPAIYFDDLASGLKATGNLIEHCHWGFLIGGGRDNIMTDNVVVDCKLGFQCDARGLGWAKTSEPTMMERLKAVPYESEPWRSRYPNLVTILNHEPMAPMGNIMIGNIILRSGKLLDRTEKPYETTTKYSRNEVSDEKGSWTQVTGAPSLPVKSMGLVQDSIRKSLPPSRS